MRKEELFIILKELIINYKKDEIILVAIDGIDASGKTTFSNELSKLITERPVVNLTMDSFHNSKEIRLHKGEFSPVGYYLDSFDYNFIIDNVLEPIVSGINEITPKKFDYKNNQEIDQTKIIIPSNAIVIFEGIFILRKELMKFWDISIFLEITWEEMILRAIKRDLEYFESEEILRDKYRRRYMPGQKIYLSQEKPDIKSNVLIDFNDCNNPEIIRFDFSKNI